MSVTPRLHYLLRPGVNYQPKRLSLAAAYGDFQANPEVVLLDRNSIPELPFQQQISYSQPAGRLVLRQRLRVDERVLGSPNKPGQERFRSLQNRLYEGIGYRSTKYEAIEVGGFNQRFQPTGVGRSENKYVVWVTSSSTAPMK